MSNWGAVEKGGEPISAWEFRAIFLKYGTTYEEFFCPFCDIPLCAYLIYFEGETSKSPHFSARWGDHIHDCDGEPAIVDAPKRKPPKAHYKLREMHFPEAFTDRPPPRKQRPAGLSKPLPPPTSIEVSTRRKKASSLGRPIPKTYLLQPIVEAYNSVLRDGFELAKEEKWSEDQRRRWMKDTLSGMTLRLDDATNYEDAFRTPTYINGNHPRIYHGTGTITFKHGSYVIESKLKGKCGNIQLPFRVVVRLGIANEASPRAHTALMSVLESFAARTQEVRWYIYGMPINLTDLFVINVENLDYLYIKKAFQGKPQ